MKRGEHALRKSIDIRQRHTSSDISCRKTRFSYLLREDALSENDVEQALFRLFVQLGNVARISAAVAFDCDGLAARGLMRTLHRRTKQLPGAASSQRRRTLLG